MAGGSSRGRLRHIRGRSLGLDPPRVPGPLVPTIDELMREAVADLPGGHRCHRAPRGFCATAVE